MLYNIIYFRIFYNLLYIIWLYDHDYDICDNNVIGIMFLSHFCDLYDYHISLLFKSKINFIIYNSNIKCDLYQKSRKYMNDE